MDHKAWPWKKTTEKTVVGTDELNNISLKRNEEQIQNLLAEKAELANQLKNLNEKLSAVLAECNAKDDLMKKHENMIQEVISGFEKANAKAESLKRELDEAIRRRVTAEERFTSSDAALKECMQQLCFVREEQEKRILDAVMKTSRQFEKDQTIIQEKLAGSSRRLAEAEAENTHLGKALLAKSKMIEDLNRQRNHTQAELKALLTRLESKEKENVSLKYGIRVLERELEIRNEEREFNCRTAEASHKQHLEDVKKIAKLESECQRLRLLVRKRLPGPAAFAKMKDEAEALGRDSIEMRSRKLNASPIGITRDSERIDYLTEQLFVMEEGNKNLREALNKKINELQFSRNMYSRTASKLLEFESHLEESSKGQTNTEPSRRSNVSYEVSFASISDIDNEDKVSCADSWASALLCELEHFKNKKQKSLVSLKTPGASEMNLMDDFAEMEKLAVVSVDNPFSRSPLSPGEANTVIGSLETRSDRNSLEAAGKDIIPISDNRSNFSESSVEIKAESVDKLPRWLHDIVNVILEYKNVSQSNPDDIHEDIRQALSSINHSGKNQRLHHHEASDPSRVKSSISLKPSESYILADSPRREIEADQNLQSDLSKPINKIIELIDGLNLGSQANAISQISSSNEDRNLSCKNPERHSGFTVRVLQWKTSELSHVLQRFLNVCRDLLSAKADLNKFAQELSSVLDWIVNHCFSLQDVSSMREEIKNRFDWDDSQSESEAEVGVIGQVPEADKCHLPVQQFSSFPMVVASSSHDTLFQTQESVSHLNEEDRKSRDELSKKEAEKKESKGRFQLNVNKGEFMVNQIQECDKSIANLKKELETLKESGGLAEGRAETQTLAKAELETLNKNKHQPESDSVKKHEIPNNERKREEQQSIRSELEITAASEKLAECQETILHLGSRLKALANSRESTFFDKVVSTPTDKANITNVPPKKKLTTQRSSLLDRMKAEDNAEESKDHNKSPKINKGKEGNLGSKFITNETIEVLEHILLSDATKGSEEHSNAIVPRKKDGVKGLWKKLLWRRKKGNSKKLPLPLAS